MHLDPYFHVRHHARAAGRSKGSGVSLVMVAVALR
jgi:hypothetical protein